MQVRLFPAEVEPREADIASCLLADESFGLVWVRLGNIGNMALVVLQGPRWWNVGWKELAVLFFTHMQINFFKFVAKLVKEKSFF